MSPFDIEHPRFVEQEVKDQQVHYGFPNHHDYRMQHGFQIEEEGWEKRRPNGIKHPIKDDSEQKTAIVQRFFDCSIHILIFF